MPKHPAGSAAPETTSSDHTPATMRRERRLAPHEMACPVCGEAMPDLKGGKATICPNCGFKDSCCF